MTQPSTDSNSQVVHVSLGDRSYDVVIGSSLLGQTGERCAGLGLKGRCAVITDSTVAPLYADLVLSALKDAGFDPTLVTVSAGEASKSMTVVEDCCRQMIQAGLDRSAFVIALGGGVVGDLAGFVAAIFFRGIPFVQIPTTIVSQVDSSVGGKTGVNAPEGKNLIGAFHQPRLVIADVATLASLPVRERNEGFAEIIKHAAIRDASLLELVDQAVDPAKPINPDLIQRNVEIKARVVEEDEKETAGTRALLNFGHTIGHAIESSAGYGALLHGEAISLGTVAAARLSVANSGLSQEAADRIIGCLRDYGLPTQLSGDIPTATIMERLATDKKFKAGAIRFVLLRSLGDAFVSDQITAEMIETEVEKLR